MLVLVLVLVLVGRVEVGGRDKAGWRRALVGRRVDEEKEERGIGGAGGGGGFRLGCAELRRDCRDDYYDADEDDNDGKGGGGIRTLELGAAVPVPVPGFRLALEAGRAGGGIFDKPIFKGDARGGGGDCTSSGCATDIP